MLQVKTNVPFNTPAPVERAFEVNEPSTDQSNNAKAQSTYIAQSISLQHPRNVGARPHGKVYKSEREAKKDFVQALRRKNEFEVVVNDDSIVDTMSTPVTIDTSSDSSDTELSVGRGQRSRYEIPDDHLISRKAKKILGDKKEVEMQEMFTMTMAFGGMTSRNERDRDHLLVPIVDPSGERDSPVNEFLM